MATTAVVAAAAAARVVPAGSKVVVPVCDDLMCVFVT